MRSLVFISFVSCSFSPSQISHEEEALTTCGQVTLPSGYSRIHGKDTVFTTYLRTLGFKEKNTVLLYDGTEKGNQNAHYRVLDLGVGKKDLQQCADAVIRLRAEYLFKQKRFSEIQFHFTSGHLCKWTDYAEGWRPRINGSSVDFIKLSKQDSSKKNFTNYLDLIYSYCGTASLHKELKTKSIDKIEPGDVFIQTRNPYGHAVMVMDVAKNEKGEKIFTLAQSYMPAQEIHILKNPGSETLSPWYNATEGCIETPEWTFGSGDLKSW
ncbi:MAG: DUF4846 domain-containing protein [Bacteroidia bacterium]